MIVLLLATGVHVLAGGALVIYAPPVRGRVIDERTGKPLAGAVVVGQWITKGLDPWKRIHASETITKADGTYVLPGMPLRVRGLWQSFRGFRDPELWIYKPGYGAGPLTNSALGKWGYASEHVWSMSPRRECYWNGKTIPMYPVDDIKAEARALESIVDVVMRNDRLHPRHYPLVWSAIVEGSRRVPESAYSPGQSNPEKRFKSLMRKN